MRKNLSPEEQHEKTLATIKRQRRKIQKQLKEYEEDMEFLGISDSDKLCRTERQWLYGNDL